MSQSHVTRKRARARAKTQGAFVIQQIQRAEQIADRIAVRVGVLTTEDAEKTEESQKYLIVLFRVVRVFRGYQSRWLHAGCSRNQLTAILAAQNACIVENLFGSKRIQLFVVRKNRRGMQGASQRV